MKSFQKEQEHVDSLNGDDEKSGNEEQKKGGDTVSNGFTVALQ